MTKPLEKNYFLSTPPRQAERPFWTLERYHRAIDAGVFTEDDAIELLFGEIIYKMPIGVPHREYLKTLRKYLRPFEDAYDFGIQDPVTLPNHSEPEPDLSMITQKRYTRKSGHPGPDDIHLLVEVSGRTLLADRTDKATAYAISGIKEYWIVNIPDDQIELHLHPNVKTGEYDLIAKFGRGSSFTSPLLGSVNVDDVLPELEEE